MATFLPRVKSRLFIPTRRKSLHLLEGQYASMLMGRSHEFEDLREYEPGDQIRDIDWRATARLGSPHIKRSRATRMHTILFVVDTGRSMAALAPDERPKKELVLTAVGALGILAVRHGDDFTVVSGDSANIHRQPVRRSEAALEHALRTINDQVDAADHSDRDGLLELVASSVARRRIMVMVTDEAPLSDRAVSLIRRLRAQHEMLWITVRDADPVGGGVSARHSRDVDSGWSVPRFLQGNSAVIAELAAARAAEDERRSALLDEGEIAHVEMANADQVVPDLLRLLAGRSRAYLR